MSGIHLRGESCSLRGAIVLWLVFCVVLAFGHVVLGFVPTKYRIGNYWIDTIETILIAPEGIILNPILKRIPSAYFRQHTVGHTIRAITLPLPTWRSIAVFMWGVYRLRGGKHAPYAETLWLLVICSFVRVFWLWPPGSANPFLYYLLTLLGLAGAAIFCSSASGRPRGNGKRPCSRIRGWRDPTKSSFPRKRESKLRLWCECLRQAKETKIGFPLSRE